ncbi:SDR family NAD(P)-dependent oxidoreductase [Algihabitans albus]|uniref:SDR family NAD(P)-dependent oxidoreductase n=1 Tax=Algihabitans albus TaxID=2164067 RepID=UPI000E5D7EE1|nr:SDR family NAD(P)-dependent oxidoreductase [Algihabitans albus]
MTLPFRKDLFSEHRALVTGAGRGIGQAVARALLACGATVLAHSGVTARKVEEVFPDLSPDEAGRVTLVSADLTRPESAAELIGAAGATLGGLDLLINNAGTMLGRMPAVETTAAHYDAVTDLNARSVVLLSAAAIPLLRASTAAAIVNTVSISARTGGSPGSSVYSAAKAFVSTHTRALARELAADGIRVNAVSPGTIMTDFHRRYSSPEKLEATAAAIPVKRLGTAADCVGTYLFLASPETSAYITGQIIEVNGGQLMA